ncbi:MAG: AbrB/MazE/SpoVT family DNA-binding domain-containing protein [Deltaproteobacteria bacterium]|nr:AbrB/MazE/SpoVT family DNA-binding domain-containing protein [Deltaproteobacteria bacterium]
MAQQITIDATGRIVIPRDIRRRYHLRGGSRLQISEDGSCIVLEPALESAPLADVDGLLVVQSSLKGEVIDHRDLRDERLISLIRGADDEGRF